MKKMKKFFEMYVDTSQMRTDDIRHFVEAYSR